MAYDNIKIDKSLYTTGKSFTDALESLDPSSNYKNTELEGLDAFERQLKRFDIKVSGPDSDTVSKFFKTADSAALFPEFISRAVRQGMETNSKVDNIVAVTTNIDSLDYRTIDASSLDNEDIDIVTEGSAFPEVTIKVTDKHTRLKKYGTMLTASYEAIKFQKLDIFSIALKKLGECIARTQFKKVIDEFSEMAVEHVIASSNTELTYSDLVSLWSALSPYNMTTLICSKKSVEAILAMPEFRDANAGLDFHGTGKLVTPFGAEIIVSEYVGDKAIIGLDRNYAIEKVQASPITTDFDKIIDRQIERATISTIVGFAPIFSSAMQVLTLAE